MTTLAPQACVLAAAVRLAGVETSVIALLLLQRPDQIGFVQFAALDPPLPGDGFDLGHVHD